MSSSKNHEHIPYEILVGYVDGVLGESDLRKHESQWAECIECAESVAFVRRHRAPAHMLWTDEGLVLIPPFLHEKHELSSQHERWLKNSFIDFGSRVNMVAGEANTKVYTRDVATTVENVLSGARGELADDEKTKIVCGPVVVIDKQYSNHDRAEGTILTRLQRSGNFVVYFSDKRQREHFRICGGNVEVYVETVHSVSEGTRESFIYRHDPIVCNRYAAKFRAILASPDVRLSEDVKEDFVFLTENELQNLKLIVDDEQLVYDELGKNDLQRFIEENHSRVFAEGT